MGSSSHVPHISIVASPLGIPAQSAHEELSPPHTPHSSVSLLPQFGSKSLLFRTNPGGTEALQNENSKLSLVPRPSPSESM